MPPELPHDPERLGSYLICATPRTGSSLLCGLLDSTGVAGHPESWFRRLDEREFAARWGIADPSDGTFGYAGYFRAAVAAGSTANGVFAARIMWGTMDAAEPGFDFGQVRGLVRQIEEDNAAWEAWFTAEGIRPHRVLYEDLDDDPVGIASGVLGFLGLDLPAGREITVRHKRLADEFNAQWVESYRLHETRERQGRPSGAGAGAGGCGG